MHSQVKISNKLVAIYFTLLLQYGPKIIFL